MFDGGWESEPHAGPGRAWSQEPPGPALAAALAGREPVDLAVDGGSDAAERIGAWEAVASWATARQLRETAEYAQARVARVRQAAGPVEQEREAVAMELATYGRVAPRTGEHRLHHAQALVERLPRTLEALEAGLISPSHARVVVEQTENCSDASARAVDDALWRATRERTPTQLRETVRRIVLRLDPDALLRRARRAEEERTVRYWSDDDGATGVITARMPATEARGVFAVIDTVARRAGDPVGDGDRKQRSLGNKRADALRDLVLDAASGLAYGADHRPGEDPVAEEPVPAPQPAPADGPAPAPEASPAPATPEEEPGRASDARAPGRDPATGCGDTAVPPVRTEVRVTIAWEVLAGLSDHPAELEGHGPIPAHAARAMAVGPDAIWRRLLTDPVTGTAEHLDLRRYRPPARLQDFVRSRDLTCAAPGCRVPAARCDLDHVVPDDHTAPDGGPGRTSAHNLKPCCRRHHRLKTHGGWSCHTVPDPDGARAPALRWTSPTGGSWIVRAPALGPLPWEDPAPGARTDGGRSPIAC